MVVAHFLNDSKNVFFWSCPKKTKIGIDLRFFLTFTHTNFFESHFLSLFIDLYTFKRFRWTFLYNHYSKFLNFFFYSKKLLKYVKKHCFGLFGPLKKRSEKSTEKLNWMCYTFLYFFSFKYIGALFLRFLVFDLFFC